MLLWLNGMTTTQKHPMETLMDNYAANPINILPLLIEDEFFIQAKNLNPKVIDFIRKYQQPIATQLLDLIVQHIDEVNETNHDHVVVYPILATEFFELDLPPLTQMMLQEFFIDQLFSGLNKTQDQVHEPQWSNIHRLFTLMIAKEPQIACQAFFKTPLLKLFLNHLQSATVNNILIQLYNPENGNFEEIKLELLELGFKGFEIMEEMSVLNFTYLIHEIMTRYFSNDFCQKLVKFIVSSAIITQMFNCLEKNHDKLFLAKSSAHILSLISNFYSYTMQNINIYEENFSKKQIEENPEIAYHTQLTTEFESSDFMRVFPQSMELFVKSFDQILQNDNRRLRTLRLKLLEIFDNLTRISNIKLWKAMNTFKMLNQIVDIYFKYQNSDIYHSIFEKLLLYILNRAISDFHPFWCTVLIEEIDIYTKVADLIKQTQSISGYVYLLANHLIWFQKELNEKLVIDGSLAKYFQSLKKIEECILFNDKWRRVVPILNLINQKNALQLGQSEPNSLQNISIQEPVINNAGEPSVNNAQCLFNKVKNNTQQNITNISGDEPPEFESPERGQEQAAEEYQYEPKKSPEKRDIQQTPPKTDNEFLVPEEIEIVQELPQSQPVPYNVEQIKNYNFVQEVYLSPTKIEKKQNEKTEATLTPEKEVTKRVDMMSISLQEFVKPIDKQKFSSDQKLEKSSSGEKLASPNKKTASDIVKKYSNMSKSLNFGQAQPKQQTVEPLALSVARKKSMESSLKLKQLDAKQNEEFKILLTNIGNNKKEESKKILTNDTNRVLMVDELDKEPEVNSLRNSIVNLSNVSFSSTSSKKRTIKFKKQRQTQSLDQNMNNLNNGEKVQEVPQNSKTISFSLSSSTNLRDSFLSSQSSVTEEKKFKSISKKDQQFLNYIRNMK